MPRLPSTRVSLPVRWVSQECTEHKNAPRQAQGGPRNDVTMMPRRDRGTCELGRRPRHDHTATAPLSRSEATTGAPANTSTQTWYRNEAVAGHESSWSQGQNLLSRMVLGGIYPSGVVLRSPPPQVWCTGGTRDLCDWPRSPVACYTLPSERKS